MDVYTTGYQESRAACTLRLFFLSDEGLMGVCVWGGWEEELGEVSEC